MRNCQGIDPVRVVWALPSRLINRIEAVPSNVELDIMSTAWATLRRLRGQPCHLLLLNLELPDSTGPALAARVRILHSDLPIVLTTDRSEKPELGMNLAALRLLGPFTIPVPWSVLLDRVPSAGVCRDGLPTRSTRLADRVVQQPAV